MPQKINRRTGRLRPCAMRCATCLVLRFRAGEGGGSRRQLDAARATTRATTCIIDGVRDSGLLFSRCVQSRIRRSSKRTVLPILRSWLHRRHRSIRSAKFLNSTPSYDGIFSVGGNGSTCAAPSMSTNRFPRAAHAAFRINLMAHKDDVRGTRQDRSSKRLGFAPSICVRLGHADAANIELPASS